MCFPINTSIRVSGAKFPVTKKIITFIRALRASRAVLWTTTGWRNIATRLGIYMIMTVHSDSPDSSKQAEWIERIENDFVNFEQSTVFGAVRRLDSKSISTTNTMRSAIKVIYS